MLYIFDISIYLQLEISVHKYNHVRIILNKSFLKKMAKRNNKFYKVIINILVIEVIKLTRDKNYFFF